MNEFDRIANSIAGVVYYRKFSILGNDFDFVMMILFFVVGVVVMNEKTHKFI